jgi:hypothetical protein
MKTARGMTLQSAMDDWVPFGDVHGRTTRDNQAPHSGDGAPGTPRPTGVLADIARPDPLERCGQWLGPGDEMLDILGQFADLAPPLRAQGLDDLQRPGLPLCWRAGSALVVGVRVEVPQAHPVPQPVQQGLLAGVLDQVVRLVGDVEPACVVPLPRVVVVVEVTACDAVDDLRQRVGPRDEAAVARDFTDLDHAVGHQPTVSSTSPTPAATTRIGSKRRWNSGSRSRRLGGPANSASRAVSALKPAKTVGRRG